VRNDPAATRVGEDGGEKVLQAPGQSLSCSLWRGQQWSRYPHCSLWKTPQQSEWIFPEGTAAHGGAGEKCEEKELLQADCSPVPHPLALLRAGR